MESFFRASAGALIAVILSLVLEKQGKDIALLLSVSVCSMIVVVAVTYFRPVMEFLERLQRIGELSTTAITSLLKILGIGLITQVSGMVCTDAGNSALANALEILGSAVILYLSLPVFSALLEIVERILGEL